MKRWLPVLGALGGGLIAFAIAWVLAGDDTQKLGDWRGGAERFIGRGVTKIKTESSFHHL